VNEEKLKYKSCVRCGYENETAEKKCPQCGRRLWTKLEIRIRGFILIICGGFLATVLGNLSIWAISLLAPWDNTDSVAIYGGITTIVVLLIVFSFLFLFGLMTLAAGTWQLLFGRLNMKIVFIISLLIFLLILGGQILTIILLGRDLFAQ
jgi:hypothetical protein